MLHFSGIPKFLPLLRLHVGVSDYTWRSIIDHLLYCFICDAIFFTCMHAHIALSNKTKSLLKIAELEIITVGVPGDDRESWLCRSTLTQCMNRYLGQ